MEAEGSGVEKWAGLSEAVRLLQGRGGNGVLTDALTGPLSLSLLESWPASSLACSISTRICTLPTLRSTPLVTSFVCWGRMGRGPHAYSNSVTSDTELL